MAEILSLSKARKAKKLAERQITAAENRTRFGRTGAEKQAAEKAEAAERTKLDGHKRSDD